MGSEQSSLERTERSRMTPAQVERLLEAQRLNYERKCQEMMEQAARQSASQAAASPVVESSPYQYVSEELHAFREEMQNPYVNHNASTSGMHSNYQNNNHYNRTETSRDFVFVNNNRSSPAPSAPPAPAPAPRIRPRSVSRNRYNGDSENSELYCPTCRSLFNLTIYQCCNGHSSCSGCKFNGRDCGICGLNITTMRNYKLEEYIAQRKVACPHKSSGCKLFISIADMDTHVRECPFKEQPCPLQVVFRNCNWSGKLNQIAEHFDSLHPTQRQTDVDTEMRLMNISNNIQQLHLVVLGVYNFLFHLKVSEADQNIYMTVQLIGTKMSAAKWYYEINVYNKSENRRKYAFSDSCNSSSESVEELFNENKCAVLPVAYAKTFLNNGALTYKFFIKKTSEGTRGFSQFQRGKELRQKY